MANLIRESILRGLDPHHQFRNPYGQTSTGRRWQGPSRQKRVGLFGSFSQSPTRAPDPAPMAPAASAPPAASGGYLGGALSNFKGFKDPGPLGGIINAFMGYDEDAEKYAAQEEIAKRAEKREFARQLALVKARADEKARLKALEAGPGFGSVIKRIDTRFGTDPESQMDAPYDPMGASDLRDSEEARRAWQESDAYEAAGQDESLEATSPWEAAGSRPETPPVDPLADPAVTSTEEQIDPDSGLLGLGKGLTQDDPLEEEEQEPGWLGRDGHLMSPFRAMGLVDDPTAEEPKIQDRLSEPPSILDAPSLDDPLASPDAMLDPVGDDPIESVAKQQRSLTDIPEATDDTVRKAERAKVAARAWATVPTDNEYWDTGDSDFTEVKQESAFGYRAYLRGYTQGHDEGKPWDWDTYLEEELIRSRRSREERRADENRIDEIVGANHAQRQIGRLIDLVDSNRRYLGMVQGRISAFNTNPAVRRNLDEMVAIQSELTPAMRVPGSGATSDFEARMMQQALTSATTNPDAAVSQLRRLRMKYADKRDFGRNALKYMRRQVTAYERGNMDLSIGTRTYKDFLAGENETVQKLLDDAGKNPNSRAVEELEALRRSGAL